VQYIEKRGLYREKRRRGTPVTTATPVQDGQPPSSTTDTYYQEVPR
jgi:hypothetical protein